MHKILIKVNIATNSEENVNNSSRINKLFLENVTEAEESAKTIMENYQQNELKK